MQSSLPASHSPLGPDATRWYRLALLLTGNETAACGIMRPILAGAPDELAQIRSEKRRKIWIIRQIRSGATQWRQEKAAQAEASDPGSFPARIAALPEPARSAFALFHCLEGDLSDHAAQLGLGSAAFADALAKARLALAPGSVFPEQANLRLHRPWTEDDSKVRKAVEAAKDQPALADQIAADLQWHEAIEGMALPEELAALSCSKPQRMGFRALIRQPVVLAIVLALLVVMGVVIYVTQNRGDDFPGKETVEEVVENTATAAQADFEEIAPTEVGKLGDWFVMNGFEGFAVPTEWERAKAVGCRVYRHQGLLIADVALAKGDARLLVMRAADFKGGVQPGGNHRFQAEEWAVAVRTDKVNLYLLMMPGDEEKLPELMRTMNK